MIIRNTTEHELRAALSLVNEQYGGNITFRRLTPRHKSSFTVTLTVHSSKGPGASLNPYTGRRISAACWHVHGHFFNILLQLNKSAVIITSSNPKKIYMIQGHVQNNWHDWNAGSVLFPYNASEKCECN